jgi:hypothetical protein
MAEPIRELGFKSFRVDTVGFEPEPKLRVSQNQQHWSTEGRSIRQKPKVFTIQPSALAAEVYSKYSAFSFVLKKSFFEA